MLMVPLAQKVIDVTLDLDARTFRMRTYEGFAKDMQFEVEVIKEYDAAVGLGQIVRGAHMRLHVGTHVDAPSHMQKGRRDLHEMPLDTFYGPAVIADVRHRKDGAAITVEDLEQAVGDELQAGDRLLLRTDQNQDYDGSPAWMARAPYVSEEATDWCIDKRISLVGFDFYHGQLAPGEKMTPNLLRMHKWAMNDIITLPGLKNLNEVSRKRVTLIALPLKIIGVEASPIRAIILEDRS